MMFSNETTGPPACLSLSRSLTLKRSTYRLSGLGKRWDCSPVGPCELRSPRSRPPSSCGGPSIQALLRIDFQRRPCLAA